MDSSPARPQAPWLKLAGLLLALLLAGLLARYALKSFMQREPVTPAVTVPAATPADSGPGLFDRTRQGLSGLFSPLTGAGADPRKGPGGLYLTAVFPFPGDPAQALAVIADREGSNAPYRIGESTPGGYVVSAIETGRVVLEDSAGKSYTLSLPPREAKEGRKRGQQRAAEREGKAEKDKARMPRQARPADGTAPVQPAAEPELDEAAEQDEIQLTPEEEAAQREFEEFWRQNAEPELPAEEEPAQ